jgi:hypothetical protein
MAEIWRIGIICQADDLLEVIQANVSIAEVVNKAVGKRSFIL